VSASTRLAELEARVEHALVSGDESELEVLGYGEISCVLASHDGVQALAAKRLPLFDTTARFEAYREAFESYIERLSATGVRVLPSSLESTPAADGRVAGWCRQPLLEPATLAPTWLGSANKEKARWLFESIAKQILTTVGPHLGLDGQLSNWAVVDGGLSYFDVTTPMMRDEMGRDVLDIDLFVASMPWALRGPVRRFALRAILDTYYRPRQVLVDLLGNFIKEGATAWLPAGLEVVNEIAEPAIDETEVRSYYRQDARMYAVLQRLRRIDRAWQRKVRRRPYAFLLPGNVERHV
jgi:hypothetical protein